LTRAGFWDVRRANGAPELIAVHTDRRESDLTPVPPTPWRCGKAPEKPIRRQRPVPQARKPVSIWWYFLLALLGMAVVESIFAGKYVDPEERQPLAARKQAA
jgi:hypothetical protein